MDRNELLIAIQDIFRDVLDNENINISFKTTANDIEEWDSLTHIQLVVAIEKLLKIKFTAQEIRNWKNVGETIDSIASKRL
jgi:acyl carrier protein